MCSTIIIMDLTQVKTIMMAFRLTFPLQQFPLPKQSVKLLLSVYWRLISNVKASRADHFHPYFLLDRVEWLYKQKTKIIFPN